MTCFHKHTLFGGKRRSAHAAFHFGHAGIPYLLEGLFPTPHDFYHADPLVIKFVFVLVGIFIADRFRNTVFISLSNVLMVLQESLTFYNFNLLLIRESLQTDDMWLGKS